MARTVYQGKIYSTFNEFSGDKLFIMANGTYWVQAQYRFWYHYAYRPAAAITEENGHYILTVEGQSIRVRRISGVIESKIDGEFRGWDGNSSYKLVNGQTWKQIEYKYVYMPEVTIYSLSGTFSMHVEDTEAKVKQIK